MSEMWMGALVLVAVLIGTLMSIAYLWSIAAEEAERKLGRELTWQELIFALLVIAIAPPLTALAAFLFVFWIMPEAKSADGTMNATRSQKPNREPEPYV